MAKIHNYFEIWQGRQNLCATQWESYAPHKQTTALRYISDFAKIFNAFWPTLQHNGAAALKLSERSHFPAVV